MNVFFYKITVKKEKLFTENPLEKSQEIYQNSNKSIFTLSTISRTFFHQLFLPKRLEFIQKIEFKNFNFMICINFTH